MNTADARRKSLSHFLLEVAALLVVFPFLDELLGDGPVKWGYLTAAVGIGLLCFTLGIFLVKGTD
jgi:hypothetical protein